MDYMVLSPNGIALIHSFEELKLVSYPDSKGVWTIGWGHTGADVHPGMSCSITEAEAWFDADTAWACRAVNRNVKVEINQNQFDALVSFAFNVGATAFVESSLLRFLNEGKVAAASNEFLRWNKSGGKFVEGLERRREMEQELFLEAA